MSQSTCFVYYVSGPTEPTTPLVKIGIAVDLPNRMRGLQSMSPVALTLLVIEPGYTDLERERHQQFANLRRHGEWFLYADPIRAHVNALIASQHDGLRPLITLGQRALTGMFASAPDPAIHGEWTNAAHGYLRAVHRRQCDSLRRFFARRVTQAQGTIERRTTNGLIEREDLARALGTTGPKIGQMVDAGMLRQVLDADYPSRIYYVTEDVIAITTGADAAN